MRINQNIYALTSYRYLTKTNEALGKSLERLSSGLRINRAADDAAGLAISEKMRSQIRGLAQAVRNAQDGISLIQTAEGALNETHAILQRMRELALQASNQTTTDSDRAEIQKEINQLIGELDRIANSTEFNTKKLLNGQAGAVTNALNGQAAGDDIKVNGQTILAGNTVAKGDLEAGVKVTAGAETRAGVYQVVVTRSATAATLAPKAAFGTVTGGTLTINGYSVSLANGDTIDTVVTKINNLLQQTGVSATKLVDWGGPGSHAIKLSSTAVGSNATVAVSGSNTLLQQLGLVAATDTTTTVLSAAGTDAQGTIAGKTAIGVGNTLTLSAPGDAANGLTVRLVSVDLDPDADGTWGTLTFDAAVDTQGRVTLQIGANNSSEQRLELDLGDMKASALGVNAISVTTAQDAWAAVAAVDQAVSMVSSERAKLGAYQNRLEHTINNLSVAKENLTAAESRIRDLDISEEMMAYTRNQIISQAAMAMLAQANTMPSLVLKLLG